MKAQSAAEFLMTYGWALVIMLAVVAVLYMLGVFNPKTAIPNSCMFPTGFSCNGYKIESDGWLTLQLGQNTGQGITIMQLECTANETLPTPPDLDSPVYIANGGSGDLSGLVQCTNTDGTWPSEGDFYGGTIYVVYVDEDTPGMNHTVKGDIGYTVEAPST